MNEVSAIVGEDRSILLDHLASAFPFGYEPLINLARLQPIILDDFVLSTAVSTTKLGHRQFSRFLICFSCYWFVRALPTADNQCVSRKKEVVMHAKWLNNSIACCTAAAHIDNRFFWYNAKLFLL